MNNLQRHERSDAIKWFLVGLVIVVIIAAIVLMIGSQCFTLPPEKWFGMNPDEQTEEEEPEENAVAYDENGNPMYEDTVYEMPQSMVFAPGGLPGDSYPGVHVVATVEPDDATNKDVNFSVAFANPSSEWATGKTVTDYVNFDRVSARSCRVYCIAAFGEQIILTVASDDNPEIKATCTIDYVSDISLIADTGAGNISFQSVSWEDPTFTYEIAMNKFSYSYGVGTIHETITLESVEVNLEDEHKTAGDITTYEQTDLITYGSGGSSDVGMVYDDIASVKVLYNIEMGDYSGFYNYIVEQYDESSYRVPVTININGNYGNTATCSTMLELNYTSLPDPYKPVTNITIDSSGILIGSDGVISQ